MASWLRIALGLFSLASLCLILLRVKKTEKETGVNWKAYPGFHCLPSEEQLNEYFEAGHDSIGKKRVIGLIAAGAPLLCIAMELASLNTVLQYQTLKYIMAVLAVLCCLLQEAEALMGIGLLGSKGKPKTFRRAVGIKFAFLLLWLLGFFASLVVRGFAL